MFAGINTRIAVLVVSLFALPCFGQTKVNLANQVKGVLSPTNGGTGVANNAGATFTRSGNFDWSLTLDAAHTNTIDSNGTMMTTGNSPALLTPALGGILWRSDATNPGTISNAVVTGPVCGNGTSAPALCSAQPATQALAAPYILYKQGLPMLYPGTGTMTAGGAFTLGTNLGNSVFPARVLVWFPATTVASSGTGSAAGWYFATMSSINTGQVVDINPYTPSGTPPVWPASPTAPTTATNWTGDTASAKTFVSFVVPAGAMGLNGVLDFPKFFISTTNNANGKSYTINFGAYAAANAISMASLANLWNQVIINNTASTALQSAFTFGQVTQPPSSSGTVDTTSAVTVTLTMIRSTATDNMMLWNIYALLQANGS